MKHTGGCHCGRVRFEVMAPANLEVDQCNCSICSKSGYLHLIVPSSRFTLLRGEDELICYTFNTGAARHYFCRHCGIKSYYVPRSNPDGFSVNARCLDIGSVASMSIKPFDGQNWEENAHSLAHLSQP
ncbi:MAG: GFA family protein [Gammaproteobacteria bacterium]|nr:GFA family protein [Gammaproteobacteria bacterium]